MTKRKMFSIQITAKQCNSLKLFFPRHVIDQITADSATAQHVVTLQSQLMIVMKK